MTGRMIESIAWIDAGSSPIKLRSAKASDSLARHDRGMASHAVEKSTPATAASHSVNHAICGTGERGGGGSVRFVFASLLPGFAGVSPFENGVSGPPFPSVRRVYRRVSIVASRASKAAMSNTGGGGVCLLRTDSLSWASRSSRLPTSTVSRSLSAMSSPRADANVAS